MCRCRMNREIIIAIATAAAAARSANVGHHRQREFDIGVCGEAVLLTDNNNYMAQPRLIGVTN